WCRLLALLMSVYPREDEATELLPAVEFMFGKAGLEVSYTLQRQTIFNISLMKLYTQRPGEPSLQRRVLINNMLRRIQDELKQDGTLRPLLLPPSPPPDDPLDEGYRQAPPTFGVLVQSQPSALLMEPASVLQAELRLLDPLPTLPSGGSLSPDPPSSSPSGFLSDLALDDVLFADIDTSMYDFDPCTTTTTSTTTGSAAIATAVGGISKIAPVVTADDLIKSLASPYNGPAPQVSSNQPFKIDLTELDHIMEVLVGS
uniref:SERTA domain-containing protein n=1 Tax=Periophthalmus magnuspinnatus TaxID=409849 RepID=A0A3B3ZY47_9GOBI